MTDQTQPTTSAHPAHTACRCAPAALTNPAEPLMAEPLTLEDTNAIRRVRDYLYVHARTHGTQAPIASIDELHLPGGHLWTLTPDDLGRALVAGLRHTTYEGMQALRAGASCDHRYPVQPPHGSIARPGPCEKCGAPYAAPDEADYGDPQADATEAWEDWQAGEQRAAADPQDYIDYARDISNED
jgi:hypothetical protein